MVTKNLAMSMPANPIAPIRYAAVILGFERLFFLVVMRERAANSIRYTKTRYRRYSKLHRNARPSGQQPVSFLPKTRALQHKQQN